MTGLEQARRLLDNKVILVTGSTTGIGAATVRYCVALGARVVIHGRNRERAEHLAVELGESARYLLADLEDPTSAEALVSGTVEAFGRIDGLVNNAALAPRGTIDTTAPLLFDRVIAVNLRAPFLLIKAAMPHFRKQGGGIVINIGSINAYCGGNQLFAYATSKGGLMTMTRNLADAHGSENIRFIQLNVGWTLTEGEFEKNRLEGLADGWQHNLSTQRAPSGRLFTPEQVAAHIAFWLRDDVAPATGVVYDIEQYPVQGRLPKKEA